MKYPLGLVFDSAKHVVGKKLRGERRFPLVLTLDPLGGCVNGCGGAGNGASEHAGSPMLSVAECLAAVEECDTPVVVIGGHEPLEYPDIATLARVILKLGKHLFLYTDGTQIRRHLHLIPPVTNFFWNVRLDGTEKVHDGRAGRAVFTGAVDGIKTAKNAGFFVVVTSTIYPSTDVDDLQVLYEMLHEMHVDGYMPTPHYPLEKLCRDGCAKFHEKMHQQFREASERLGAYNLMLSPVYLEYLRGERELDCSVWASPVYGPRGWSEPCYLQSSKHAKSYKALLEETVWENYGRGLNPRCENCQCPAGFETAAILGMNAKVGDLWKKLSWQFRGNMGEKRKESR